MWQSVLNSILWLKKIVLDSVYVTERIEHDISWSDFTSFIQTEHIGQGV